MGAHGQLTEGTNWCNPRTKYKRSKNVFAVASVALTLVHLGTELSHSFFLRTNKHVLLWVVGGGGFHDNWDLVFQEILP